MSEYPVPTGEPLYFEGSTPNDYIGEVYGFVYVNITAPDIKTPFLPARIKNINGTYSIICGVGT
jgi:hypothetical protein